MTDVAENTAWTPVQAETFLKSCVLCRKASKVEIGLVRKPEGLQVARPELANFARALEKLVRPKDARQERVMSCGVQRKPCDSHSARAGTVYHHQDPDGAAAWSESPRHGTGFAVCVHSISLGRACSWTSCSPSQDSPRTST